MVVRRAEEREKLKIRMRQLIYVHMIQKRRCRRKFCQVSSSEGDMQVVLTKMRLSRRLVQ